VAGQRRSLQRRNAGRRGGSHAGDCHQGKFIPQGLLSALPSLKLRSSSCFHASIKVVSFLNDNLLYENSNLVCTLVLSLFLLLTIFIIPPLRMIYDNYRNLNLHASWSAQPLSSGKPTRLLLPRCNRPKGLERPSACCLLRRQPNLQHPLFRMWHKRKA